MTKKEIEYTVIRNAVSTLATLCAGSDIKIIDLLTGYLWDEEEAGGIKGPINKKLQTVAKCKAAHICKPPDHNCRSYSITYCPLPR